MARFGDENLYTDTLPSSDGRASGKRFTLTEAGVVTSITAGFAAATVAGTSMRGLIWRVAGGVKTDLLVVGAVTAIPAGGGWVESAVANVPLSPGDYCIDAVCNGNDALHAHNTFGTGDGPDSEMSSSVDFDSPPATWPGNDATYDYNVSIYATYTPGSLADIVGDLNVTLAAATLSATGTLSAGGGGGTFGDQTTGSSTFPTSDGRALLQKFTMPVAGKIVKIFLRFDASGTAGTNVKGLGYTGNGTVPTTRLGASATGVAIPAGGGVVETVVDIDLAADAEIWLGGVTNSFQAVWRTSTGTPNLSRMETSYASPPTTWTQSGTGSNAKVTVYAEYTTAGGGGIIGVSNITLAAATLAAAGTLALKANSNVTLQPATLAATGLLALKGTSNVTLAPATLSAAGRLALTSNANVSLAPSTLSAAGTLALKANSNVTLAAATLAATGSLQGVGSGTVNTTLAASTLAATGQLSLKANSNVTLLPAALDASARLALKAQSDVTLLPASLDATGQLQALGGGNVSATLLPASLSANASLAIQAVSNVTLIAATLAATGDLEGEEPASPQTVEVMIPARINRFTVGPRVNTFLIPQR